MVTFGQRWRRPICWLRGHQAYRVYGTGIAYNVRCGRCGELLSVLEVDE